MKAGLWFAAANFAMGGLTAAVADDAGILVRSVLGAVTLAAIRQTWLTDMEEHRSV